MARFLLLVLALSALALSVNRRLQNQVATKDSLLDQLQEQLVGLLGQLRPGSPLAFCSKVAGRLRTLAFLSAMTWPRCRMQYSYVTST